MVFDSAFGMPIYTAQSGTWDIDFEEPIQCDDTVITPGDFFGFPSDQVEVISEANLDFDPPVDVITLNPGPNEISLNQSTGTNIYGQGVTLGGGGELDMAGQEFPYVDIDGELDYNQAITADFEALLTGDDTMQGMVSGTGPGGCSYSTGFTMSFNPPSV